PPTTVKEAPVSPIGVPARDVLEKLPISRVLPERKKISSVNVELGAKDGLGRGAREPAAAAGAVAGTLSAAPGVGSRSASAPAGDGYVGDTASESPDGALAIAPSNCAADACKRSSSLAPMPSTELPHWLISARATTKWSPDVRIDVSRVAARCASCSRSIA